MTDAMTQDTLISPEMAAAVGREYEWATSYPIDASDIRRWAVAMYYPKTPPKLYWDEAYAKATRWGGIVAPEEFNPFAWMRAEPAGDMGAEAARPWPELKLGVPCPEFKANIFAGLVVEYTKVRMRPGDVMKSAIKLAGYHEKRGRLGLMLFTTREETWTNQNGERVRTSRSDLIRYL
ncbi:MAG: hypothetical protein JWQ97_4053 [Phenylobacterium sp.]|nr:hypothetical protein [Phenylobacterium sp.]